MTLDWLPRDNELKNHELWGDEFFSTEPPSIMYELRPVKDLAGNIVEGLNSAWIILNNPAQYNSYTTKMIKGVIAGFHKASMDPSVVAAVLTAVGDRAFCTGGNTKEYAEYYAARPAEYGKYMDLFNAMVDSILNCKKPVICRVNGMRIAGGQEIGTACDITISSDLAVFGQAGPRHGSAPVGGATDFLSLFLSIEDTMWSCVSCELWSAYKMKLKGLVSRVVPVLRLDEKWLRNPLVITDRFIEDGEIVYGEFKTGEETVRAKEIVKSAKVNFELLDRAVDETLWTLTNLFPGCLMVTIDSIRQKKKFFWDQMKLPHRHWLAVNMMTEAYLGFHAFNTRKLTGRDTIDFIKYRQLLSAGKELNEEFFEAVLPKPNRSQSS